MKSLAARALAAGTVAAGALMISVPAAGAATHGKGGSGQEGNGQGAAQAGKSHGHHGHGNKSGKSEGQGGSATHKAPSSTGGHKGDKHSSSGTKHEASNKAGKSASKKPAGAGGHGSQHARGQKAKGANSGKGGQAPAGNNGTIKLDQSPLTSGAGANHANHPHLSCQLALSFFGFDAGTDYATVQFSAQPPSGKFTPVPVTSGPTQFSFSVAKRTGGGQLDTSEPYTLDVSGLKASHQGYHIRVVTHVTYSQGSDVKQKVFWYEPCSNQATSSSEHSSSGGSLASGRTKKTSRSEQSSHTELRRSEVTKTKSSTSYGFGLGAGPHGVSARKTTRLESSGSSKSYGYGGYGLGAGPGGNELASSNSGQLPSGAGTDLGWFSPGNGSLSSELELVGGLGLLGSASLLVRRMRKRRA